MCPFDLGFKPARIESDLESVAMLLPLACPGDLDSDLGSGEAGGNIVSSLKVTVLVGEGGRGDAAPSLLGGRYTIFSFDSARLCREPLASADGRSGVAFSSTGLSALLLSLCPMPVRQSSSRTFFGDTSIFEGVRTTFCSCSACSRCSHLANAAFFFTGDSERSLFVLDRVTKGSLAES